MNFGLRTDHWHMTSYFSYSPKSLLNCPKTTKNLSPNYLLNFLCRISSIQPDKFAMSAYDHRSPELITLFSVTKIAFLISNLDQLPYG